MAGEFEYMKMDELRRLSKKVSELKRSILDSEDIFFVVSDDYGRYMYDKTRELLTTLTKYQHEIDCATISIFNSIEEYDDDTEKDLG